MMLETAHGAATDVLKLYVAGTRTHRRLNYRNQMFLQKAKSNLHGAHLRKAAAHVRLARINLGA